MNGWIEECLTGKTRHRNGFFGCLILQVEVLEKKESFDRNGLETPSHGEQRKVWRDAKTQDLKGIVL